ncbi:Putative uncharacterized protein [Taphrina deformans PYCC 5710]|uniref:1-phosphatidylinositol 4-kinase n=1 Tax=Taphrina deformans (strain PYCC 5710 / ATCC 11124 / CBS 356.35 / IMI 108563 / JCM 9778 / NBRC 8474) TaxID=1097556 RepID=R4XCJ8_TAPDE|nr:Putative uncharacterized protein [Taphrina deformans PYCC 5710]|eukprot:CCG82086.1 Putative uncharacterized protein [Taphrina deformans PYCC 5710]
MSNSIMNDVTSINSVQAIGVLGSECRDSQVSVLALNILLQKAAKSSMAAKRQIVIEVARIALHCSDNDISRVCDFYASLETTTEGREFVDAIIEGRNVLSRALRQTQSATAELYLICLLRAGILMVKSPGELDLNSILSPLSTLLMNGTSYNTGSSFDLKQLFHNFWFTLVLAGYTVNSSKVVDEMSSLKIIARHSPSLALETMTDAFETDLESYPLLKQAHHHDQTRALQLSLENFVPSNTVKARNYSEAVYMSALALLENLKCRAGVATGSLTYYRAATMVQSDIAGLLAAISAQNIRYFLSCIENSHGETSLGRELQALVIGCCDPVLSVRNHAVFIIDQIVSRIPSAFCNSLAISTLLECITLLGWAAYEEFSDKYSPNYEFRSTRTDLCITVSDSYKDRHNNLEAAQRSARKWLSVAMFESAADVRTLLTSYITIAEDHTGSMASDRGKLLAIEMAMRSSAKDQPTDTSTIRDSSDAFLGELTLRHLQATAGSYFPPSADASEESAATLKRSTTLYERSLSRKFIPFSDLREKLCSHVSRILHSDNDDVRILRQLVEIPFNIFSIAAMKLGTSLWARVVTDKPHLETTLLAEISRCWLQTIKHHRGLFSLTVNADDPFSRVMEYAPTDKEAIAKEGKIAKTLLAPHLNVLRFLSGRLATPQSASLEAQKILMQLLRRTMVAMTRLEVCDHIFARELRLRVLTMANHLRNALPVLGLKTIHKQFSTTLYNAALSMFSTSPRWAFGSDVGQMKVDRQLMVAILASIQSDPSYARYTPGGKEQLLIILLEQEISRIDLWLDPMVPKRTTQVDAGLVQSCLASAWQSNPAVAISLAQRFSMPSLYQAIRQYILRRPWQCLKNQYAAEYILGSSLASDAREAFKYLLYWKPVVPISATTYFLPAFRSHPLVLQYAMRSLESHPVEVTFFYVPQIVQVLRHDALGYVKRFIVETAKLSQLFAHQIIWNFDANAYKDEDATIPDSIKPTLDSIKGSMMSNLSGADKVFYETEFRFFGEVTSISGKLKPFIKRTKPEKKAKIDEEMGIIKVEQGVYLPSNPDGQVIDIDRKSGRPLQSHAKAPFMATFIIRKTKQVEAAFEDDLQVENNKDRQSVQQKEDVIEKRQSAIFKVGDDCRQDVLALQLISTFRSIFNSIGLDLYVFPYRVTATAPGCGVIDVLPNSISRDMLGREAVNGLYDYFVTTFGKPDTVAFQQARMNFVKSLAAYSVITYLLQFKDRHNGNIMYDAQGHVLHIDFGFCFDIAPGGITFESAPFKLTTEMVAVMGGSTETQSYRMFQELCIKAFLVARQYSEQIIHLVTLMLDSGLPCFKGQTTITNLRNRFHLDVSEQQASQVMLHLIAQSHQNQRTVAYDMFQKLTNGIPY